MERHRAYLVAILLAFTIRLRDHPGPTCARWPRGKEGGYDAVSGLRDPPGLRRPAGTSRGASSRPPTSATTVGDRVTDIVEFQSPQRGSFPRLEEVPGQPLYPGCLPVPGVLRVLSAQLLPLRHPAPADQPRRDPPPSAGTTGWWAWKGGNQDGWDLIAGYDYHGKDRGHRRRRAGGPRHGNGLPLRRGHHLRHGLQRRRGLAAGGGRPRSPSTWRASTARPLSSPWAPRRMPWRRTSP